MIKKIFFILYFFYFFVFLDKPLYAQTTENTDYILHLRVSNVDDLYKAYQNPKPIPSSSPPVNANPPAHITVGYNTQPTSDFSLALSDNLINFGLLSPTDFIIRENIITVTGDKSYSYSVLASEDHPLTSVKNKTIIPNTTCDNNDCTDSISGIWTNTLAYGFGYRCNNLSGNDCEDGFSQEDFYKEFADINTQSPQVIMARKTKKIKKARITYKLNIPGNQPEGPYINKLTIIALSNF